MHGRRERLFWQSNQAGVTFLVNDLEIAHTLLDIADLTNDQETRSRNLGHADRACKTVRRLIPQLTLSPAEQTHIERTLNDLKKRLEDAVPSGWTE